MANKNINLPRAINISPIINDELVLPTTKLNPIIPKNKLIIVREKAMNKGKVIMLSDLSGGLLFFSSFLGGFAHRYFSLK